MPLKTTVVGAWPKPDYLDLPDWFKPQHGQSDFDPRKHEKFKQDKNEEIDGLITRAVKDVITSQEKLGLDVITDGEICRENYVWHFCRNLAGIDFDNLEKVSYRDGACTALLPKIVGPLKHKHMPCLYKAWLETQNVANKPVKYTLPGPLTITDTTFNSTNMSRREIMEGAAVCLNAEIKALVTAGCKFVQIDEPCLLRHPEIALSYGVEVASTCFDGVESPGLEKIIHLCCGYPNKLDQDDYKKADKNLYRKLAPALESSVFTAVSIEDKEAQNDLSLLSEFKRLKVILGSIAVARSRVETVEEIRMRLEDAFTYIDFHRLVVAPDCGLGFLDWKTAEEKIGNMVKAAKSL